MEETSEEIHVSHETITSWSAARKSTKLIDLSDKSLDDFPDCSYISWDVDLLLLSENKITSITPSYLPENIVEINLFGNALTGVPDFSKVRQLKKLNLGRNKITNITTTHLPLSITDLILSCNIITDIGDFSEHKQLSLLDVSQNTIEECKASYVPHFLTDFNLSYNKFTYLSNLSRHGHILKLDLSGNNIATIPPSYIPQSITDLDVSSNQITAFPDLSEHKQLAILYLRYNKIRVIPSDHVPYSITDLNLHGNCINYFVGFSQHKQLVRLNLYDNNITTIMPSHIPRNVVSLDISFNNLLEILDLSQHIALSKLMVLGNKELHTIHALPKSVTKLVIHSAVRVLKKKCFCEVTYDLLKESIDTHALQQPPEIVFLSGLEAVLEYYSEKLMSTSEISLALLGATTAGKSSLIETLILQTPTLMDLENRTQVTDIKQWNMTPQDCVQVFDQGGQWVYSITSPIFLTSSTIVLLVHDVQKAGDNHLGETTGILRQTLKYQPGNTIIMVLTHIDMLHEITLKRNVKTIKEKIQWTIDQEMLCVKTENPDANNNLMSLLTKQRNNIRYFLVSSQSYSGIDELKLYLSQLVASQRVAIPEKWAVFYRFILKQDSNFLNLQSLREIFMPFYSVGARTFQAAKICSKFKAALQYYAKSSLVLYFESIPLLNEYIFHNRDFIVRVLKSCFHHDLESTVSSEVADKPEFRSMIDQYQKEGLLHKKLLCLLWENHELQEKNQDAILKLLEMFHICYATYDGSDTYFFPWFVQNNRCPDSITPNDVIKIDRKTVSLQFNCVFNGRIPQNAFEMIVVQLQKVAVENQYGGDRYAWKHGLLLQLGSVECFTLRNEGDSTITFCVRGDISDILIVWKLMFDIHSNVIVVLMRWQGIIKHIYFLCSHCALKKITPITFWSPEEVLHNKGICQTFVTCNGEMVPRALVRALPETDTHVHRENLERYLEDVCTDLATPEKLLYLDCMKTSEGHVKLSWGWPLRKQAGIPFSDTTDDSITNAVVEYKEGQWKGVAEHIRQAPYIFKGRAKEFRVAAQNKNGRGQFTDVTLCVIEEADEVMTEDDRKHMRDNHESFSRMHSVWEVIVRLYSRQAITPSQKEQLIRLHGDKSHPHQAAERLAEMVGRMTYEQLYYFQKTLRETGQIVLADTVPVKFLRIASDIP